MIDEGIVTYGEHEGKRVLGLRLNWEKRYITLGPVCTVLGLAFKTRDPEGLLGDRESLGITCALIPTDLPGVEIGERHDPGAAFQNGPNRGKDVFIPLDWVIGGPEQVGHGWRMLMDCLSVGRAISLPAQGTAIGKACARTTGAYARIRKQFNVPIGRFEGNRRGAGSHRRADLSDGRLANRHRGRPESGREARNPVRNPEVQQHGGHACRDQRRHGRSRRSRNL